MLAAFIFAMVQSDDLSGILDRVSSFTTRMLTSSVLVRLNYLFHMLLL